MGFTPPSSVTQQSVLENAAPGPLTSGSVCISTHHLLDHFRHVLVVTIWWSVSLYAIAHVF
jgi:hypothetical protein